MNTIGSYAEETSPPSNVNVMDKNESKEITVPISEETASSLNNNVTYKDKSKEIIVHKTLSENKSMDVSKS